MQKIRSVAAVLFAACFALQAQTTSISSEQEHQEMLDKLHLAALRAGVSGSPGGPNPANYDEALGGPGTPLPDPLQMPDEKRVTTAEQWWKVRRPQLLELFNQYEYGRVPSALPSVRWGVVSTERKTMSFSDLNGRAYNIPTITRDLIGHVDNAGDRSITVDIELHLTVPADVHDRVPVMTELAFRFPPPKPGQKPMVIPTQPGPTWQQQILMRGWGYAELYPTTIQPDEGAGLRKGIIGLANRGGARTPDQWGAIRAWAWGASRALDYLVTDPSVNAKAIGIMGHSRFGKTALVTMAYDQRFAIAYISSSGAGGADLWRRNFGEQLENVAGSGEYHWMDGNFLRYAADPLHAKDLPIDQHELIALCAPRPVFIGGGVVNGDGWTDTRGMFLSAVAASPVYQLLGARGISDEHGPTSTFPAVATPLIAGDLAFRQHTGGHTPAPNWPTFLEFATRYLHAST